MADGALNPMVRNNSLYLPLDPTQTPSLARSPAGSLATALLEPCPKLLELLYLTIHIYRKVSGWCKLDVQLHDEAGMRTCKWFRLVWAEFKQSFMTVFHQPLYHNMFTAARCVIASWTSILFCFFCHGHLLCRVLLNHPETVLYVAVDHQEQDGYKWDQTGSADLNQSETVLCI